jgi:Rrf2 family iron-sulfur cluster assembly transcriptional regulator
MKLSNKGRYAVQALADLARNDLQKPTNLTEISLRQGISLSFLEQIFLKLKNNNLVKSSRGPLGGYTLSRSPDDITISNIIEAVDEKVKTVACRRESKKGCHGKSSKCITHDLWDDLENHINNFFKKNTLRDIAYKMEKNKQSEITK